MMNVKYRPLGVSKSWQLKQRIKHGWIKNYNFLDRSEIYELQHFPRVYRIGSQLHYLALHAPEAVSLKWRTANRRFVDHYRKF